jgi:hypothetical protein
MITNDGGKTWRRRPVFSESRVGTIEGFWFDSKTNGMMNIDRQQSAEDGLRYEQYETHTGGDTWSLRQLAPKPAPLRKAAPNTGLRLRADAKTDSYRLEKRAGEAWQTVASFAVKAGQCKEPEAAPLVEPAPPEPAAEPKPAPAKPSLRKPRG